MLNRTFLDRALLVSAAGLVLISAAWALQQRAPESSASAAVGKGLANSSASAALAPGRAGTAPGPNTFFSFNAETAISLMVTDVNADGNQDIKVTVTTPQIFQASTAPGGLGAIPARYGVFITDGETGLTLTNIVLSSP